MLDMRKFYGIASVLMIISLLGVIWNLTIIWNSITIGAKISQIAGGVCFNLLLFFVFLGLYRITPSSDMAMTTINSPDLDALIKKYQGEDVAQNKANVPKENTLTKRTSKKEVHI